MTVGCRQPAAARDYLSLCLTASVRRADRGSDSGKASAAWVPLGELFQQRAAKGLNTIPRDGKLGVCSCGFVVLLATELGMNNRYLRLQCITSHDTKTCVAYDKRRTIYRVAVHF